MSTINSFESHVLRQFLVRLHSAEPRQISALLLCTNPTAKKKIQVLGNTCTQRTVGQEVPQFHFIYSWLLTSVGSLNTARVLENNTSRCVYSKTSDSRLPKLHMCYSKAKQVWTWKFKNFHFWNGKKPHIITLIPYSHQYPADTETMFLFWPHTGLDKYNYYAA